MSSVAPLGLLSPANERYVNLIRGLGKEGVIRVGGIVADYTRYQPDGTIRARPKTPSLPTPASNNSAAFSTPSAGKRSGALISPRELSKKE
jgi:hypothetical protein